MSLNTCKRRMDGDIRTRRWCGERRGSFLNGRLTSCNTVYNPSQGTSGITNTLIFPILKRLREIPDTDTKSFELQRCYRETFLKKNEYLEIFKCSVKFPFILLQTYVVCFICFTGRRRTQSLVDYFQNLFAMISKSGHHKSGKDDYKRRYVH